MPTYDYSCGQCGHVLEAFQKITEEPLKACPSCHSNSLLRGVGGGSATFRFLGNGFYITDYKKESKNQDCSCKGSCPSPSKSEN